MRYTALDATKEGFETFVIRQAIRSVDEGACGWGAAEKELLEKAVKLVDVEGAEVARVRKLAF